MHEGRAKPSELSESVLDDCRFHTAGEAPAFLAVSVRMEGILEGPIVKWAFASFRAR